MKVGRGFSAWALACVTGLSVAAGAQLGQQQPQQSRQSQEPSLGGQVVAVVNGDKITQKELQANLQSRLRGQQPDPQQMQKLQQQVLESLVESRLVEQYVLDKGPGADPKEVDQMMQRFQRQLQSRDMSLEEFLKTRGQTKKQFRKRIAGSIAWRKFQQKQMSPKKLRTFFQNNQKDFQADSFEQARQKVRQAYTAKLWNDIVQTMKPDAEIKMAKPRGRSSPPQPTPNRSPRQR